MTLNSYITPTLLAIILTGCATAQENPNYQHSTTYNGSSPYTQSATTSPYGATTQQATYANQPVYPAGYTQSGQPIQTQVNHECLSRETNRELIGGALGGTAGAFAGKELIGGTKGLVAGAVVGGALGYGIGDKSINCDPIQVAQPAQPYYTSQAVQPTVYAAPQSAHSGSVVVPSADGHYSNIVGTPGYEATRQANNTPAPTPAQIYVAPQPSYITAQEQYVPAQAPIAARSQEFYPSAAPSSTGTTLHTVVQNDTVYSLSKRLCSSLDEIQNMNGIDGSYGIQIGQTLRLPSSRC